MSKTSELIQRFLGEPAKNLMHAMYDDYVEANVRFRSKSGIKTLIIRRQLAKCCDWCAGLAGIYESDKAPDEVYRRHDYCKCMVTFRNEQGKYTDVWTKKEYQTQRSARIANIREREKELAEDLQVNLTNSAKLEQELFRKINREKAEDGHEIIDDRTYKKLTKSFVRDGGLIIRGEEAAVHLEGKGYASYLPGLKTALIRDDATVSDVLEEMYHAYQDKVNMFGSSTLDDEVRLRREIDAQKYLLRMKRRYKIPIKETELTKKNLLEYEQQLNQLLERKLRD